MKKKNVVPKRTAQYDKNQALLDRISAKFKYVPLPVKEEQLQLIGEALAVLARHNDRKRYMTEEEAAEYFTREQLMRMLLLKDGKIVIH